MPSFLQSDFNMFLYLKCTGPQKCIHYIYLSFQYLDYTWHGGMEGYMNYFEALVVA